MGLLWAITVGVVLGLIAGALLPGRRTGPLWPSLVHGVAGALLGGLAAGWLGMDVTRSTDGASHLLQLAGAALFLAVGAPQRAATRTGPGVAGSGHRPGHPEEGVPAGGPPLTPPG